MGRNLSRLLQNGSALDDREDWMMAVPGIVADNKDPEHQHRVRLVIPSISEDRVYDKWARQLVMYVGGNGYGSFFLPPEGSEVVVFGQLGEKHNLYYLGVYNEDLIVPADFRSSAVCGIRAPADLKFIAEGDMQLRMGGAHFETDGAFSITAAAGFFVNGKPF